MKLAALVIFCIASTGALAANRLPASIVQEYLQAKAASMAAHATMSDINKLLSFYKDDIVYEALP